MNLSIAKHWVKLYTRENYRREYEKKQELERIKCLPRYQKTSTKLLGSTLNLVDSLSFYYSYKEIFEDEIYRFSTDKESPLIIDGGSNIGLSIVFFKKYYPKCKILAFEADSSVFDILEANILNFEIQDIYPFNKAIWTSETFLNFVTEGADGGRLAQSIDGSQSKSVVPTVRLYDYLSQDVDFLKLDIEGAETDVVIDCSEKLENVRNLFIEYHSFNNQEQRLDELLSILRKAGFRVQIKTQLSYPKPLLERPPTQIGMDLQLNIFGYRD